jgi:MIF4G domain
MQNISSNRFINSNLSELNHQKGDMNGTDDTVDDWSVVGGNKTKRISSLAAAASNVTLQQPPAVPPRRTFSHSVRRAQSGEVSSLQQQQQQHGKQGNQRQKLAKRSQSFSIPQQLQQQAPPSKNGHSNHRRSSYGSQNSNKSLKQNGADTNASNGTTSGKNKVIPSRSHSYGGRGSGVKTNLASHNNKLKSLDEIVLFNVTGSGMTVQEMHVVRCSADLLLSQRLQFTEAPLVWTPHNRCHWQAPDRMRKIEQEQSLYYNFKPLQVNDETRWKSKVIVGTNQTKNEDQVAIKIAAITSILNKLSWTNLNKLTIKFVEALSTTNNTDASSNTDLPEEENTTQIAPELIGITMKIVVDKAMMEPHFAELYAQLSVNLATVHKLFKRTVLRLCEEQFELTGRLDGVSEGNVDAETSNNNTELKQKSSLIANAAAKKKSIGLMKFIGELYVMGLIKTSIMISCCERLLCPTDEEKLESFCKLMSTIGKRLQEQHDNEDSCTNLWNNVYCMAGKAPPEMLDGPVAPSTRIKFFLQSLIELKENNWIQVRHEHEKAQTIEQIHAQAAEEAKRGPIVKTTSSMLLTRSQSNDLFPNHNYTGKSGGMEHDNFVAVVNGVAKENNKSGNLRRTKSEAVSGLSTLQNALSDDTSTIEMSPKIDALIRPQPPKQSSKLPDKTSSPQTKISKHLDAVQCGENTKAILKEFFVSGDRGEAVLLLDEIVDITAAEHLKRGEAVITAGIFLVLEMKELHVRKFLDVISKCLDDQKVDKDCFVPALMDPLEFLRDIEIDAPQAASLLAMIIADWLTKKVDDGDTAVSSIDFLLRSPENFRNEGNPAMFATQILRARGGVITDVDAQIVQTLMSNDEMEKFQSATTFIELHNQ